MLIRLKRDYFLQIKKKVKKLEIRVAYANLRGIKAGQIVTFECGRDRLSVKMKDVRKHETFVSMLEKEDYTLIAEGKTKQEVLEICQSIYPPHKEALGVLVFEVEVID
jgi:ASC-1-like (ASCH) protein